MDQLTDNDKHRIEQEAEQRYSNDDFRRYDFKRGAEYEHKYQREQQEQQEIINSNIIEQLQIRVEQDIAKIKKLEDDAHDYSAWQSEYRASRAEVERLKAERSELKNKVIELESMLKEASEEITRLEKFDER